MKNNIIHLSETTSTNNYLKSLLQTEDFQEGTVVYTDYQTSGKGQRGNSWVSERGKNLLFSLLLYPSVLRADEQFVLSQLISLSIYNVLSTYATDMSVKWPNDIYWKDKKICGILIENNLEGEKITRSIIGVGVNLNQLFDETSFNPVSLKEVTGKDHDREIILHQIIKEVFELYRLLKFDKKTLDKMYKENMYRKEGVFLYQDTLSGEQFNASIKDIDCFGRLILDAEGKERIFGFKEVGFL